MDPDRKRGRTAEDEETTCHGPPAQCCAAADDQSDSASKRCRVGSCEAQSDQAANTPNVPSSAHAAMDIVEDTEDSRMMFEFPSRLWPRPEVPQCHRPCSLAYAPLVFQQLDIDYETVKPVSVLLGKHRIVDGEEPVVRMYGVDKDGCSVAAFVYGFQPYFYIPAPHGFTQDHIPQFRDSLNARIRDIASSREAQSCNYHFIRGIEMDTRQSIYGYHGGSFDVFLRVVVATPSCVPLSRRVLENMDGVELAPFPRRTYPTFESNYAFVLRFMTDRNIVGASWLELPANTYSIRGAKEKQTTCQVEVETNFDTLIAHEPVGDWGSIAKLRILSFDIECAGRPGIFPEPQHDPVIQIANIIHVQGMEKQRVRNVFCLKDTAHIPGADVRVFDTEVELLRSWSNFVRETDPDVLTGYNIINFDLPYLLNRAATLGISSFPKLGRVIREDSRIKEAKFSSKAQGNRENKALNISGRVQLDVLQVIQRDHHLRSYSLNSVSAHFLGEQKEDVHHSIITDLWSPEKGTPETRRRLAVYCLKDALLPLRLMDRLMVIINYIEMCRVTAVPLSYLFTRGQQVKVMSMLYRTAAKHRYLIPASKFEVGQSGYEGATVIPPRCGFYDKPIVTLDFASLYPSIMMTHNLCYSTLLTEQAARSMPPESFTRTPTGACFVKPSVRKGVLPLILEELLSARRAAKLDLARETDPAKKAVLDGRQLALKISANSVYGFTGATVGKLPCLEISASTTAFGRDMLMEVKQYVEKEYTVDNSFSHDATVVYGDTDSVMILFGLTDLKEVMQLGREAARRVSEHFAQISGSCIKLEFEKVYSPYLLMSKKKYAGLLWTKPDKPDKIDAKGIETVRRDNCPLVKVLINTCLNKILIERDVDAAIEFTKQTISDLLQNKMDISLLVISKALQKKDYQAKQAHNELAERMRKRDPATAPNIGDRVPYVIIRSTKGAKAYEKSEDPIYALNNNLALDTSYYLTNQLSKPLTRIFEPILGSRINSLLNGQHTRTLCMPTAVGALSKWTVKTKHCIGCKAAMPESVASPMCAHCVASGPVLFRKQLLTVTHLETQFGKLWAQCQRCQGSLHQEVLCTSRDCPIFYARQKMRKDLNDAQALLERFDELSNW